MQDRNLAMDGVRGYAALVVLFYHAILGFDASQINRILPGKLFGYEGYDLWNKFALTLFDGESAVNLFFLLSGAVLVGSLGRQMQEHGALRASIAFTVKRVLRIFPACVACILTIVVVIQGLSIAMPSYFAPYSLAQVVNNLLLLGPDVHGATWTLQVEMIVVPILIVAALLSARYGNAALVLFAVYALVARKNGSLVGHSILLQFSLVYFAFGALVFTEFGRRVAVLARPLGWMIPLLAYILIRQLFGLGSLMLTIEVLAGFTFLCLLAHDARISSLRIFTGPVGSFLGRVSYGFYLWNVLFLNVFFALHSHFPALWVQHPVEAGLLAGIVFVGPSLWLASLSERWIEQPGIRLGARFSQRIIHGRRAFGWQPKSGTVPLPASRAPMQV